MSKGKKKFSTSFERDYGFYLANKDKFNFAGTDVKKDFSIQYPGESEEIIKDENGNDEVVPFSIPYSETGKPAKVCFFFLDSAGKKTPCSEPELLVQLLTCKASVNMHIKTWAESWADYTISKLELQEYMIYYGCPDWVFDAIEKQKEKHLKEMISQKKWNQHGIHLQTLTLHLVELLGDEEFSSEIAKEITLAK